MRRFSRLARRPCREDSGFTLIELMIAMMVILVIMTTGLGVFFSSLSTIAYGKQRQSATAIGNRLMEELRALPYDTIRAGLYQSDLTGDSNISGSNFNPAYNTSINEVLQTTTNASQVAPLNPHTTTTIQNKTTFTSSVYVTQALAGTQPEYNLTVIVTWKSAASHNTTRTLALRTTDFSPSGCLSTATHPFSGPCQAYYYSTAGSGPGGVLVQAATPAAPAFAALPNLTSMDATLPTVSSETQIEQIATLTAKAVTSGVQRTEAVGGVTAAGSVSGIASADTDPSTASPTSTSQNTPVQTTGPLSESGSGDSLTVQNFAGDSGSATSAIAASASPACTDVASALAFTTGQPCTSSTLTPAGSALTGLWNPNGTLNALGNTTLFSVAPAPTALKTFATRFITADPTYCPSVVGAGCSAAAAVRSLGNVMIGGLPAATPNEAALAPAQFSGFAKITGYSDKVVAAAAASGASAPSAAALGTLNYWNGTGYTAISLASAHAAIVGTPFTATYNVVGGTIRVTEAGSITFPGTSTVTTGVAPCTTACTVTATSSPPSVTVRYTIVLRPSSGPDVPLADFNVVGNLGALEARSTFKAAPVG